VCAWEGVLRTIWISTLLRAAALTAAGLICFAAAFGIASLLLPELAPKGLANLCHWDCGWYEGIARNGYQVDPLPDVLQANYAFYPVFPLAARFVMALTGLGFTHAALLLNAVHTFLFAWLAIANRDVLLLRSDRDAAIFVLAFLLAPWSLYNHVPYTEMSFNIALLATFVAWQRGLFVAAAICGAILTATRVNGIFLPLALLGQLLVQERWRVLELLRAPDARFRALAVMPLGAFAFYIYLGFHVGDPLAAFHIQLGWNQGMRNPLDALVGGIRSQQLQPVLSVLAFVLATPLLAWAWSRGRVPGTLAAATIAIACTAVVSGLFSTPRYVLALFPVYLMIPALPRGLQWLAIVLLAGGLVVYVYYWFLGAGFLI
jgi:hypothetical protein